MGDLYGIIALFLTSAGAIAFAYFTGNKKGKGTEKLNQYERASKIIENDREKQNEINEIQEAVSRRDKSNRNGLLHYATTDDNPGDAG